MLSIDLFSKLSTFRMIHQNRVEEESINVDTLDVLDALLEQFINYNKLNILYVFYVILYIFLILYQLIYQMLLFTNIKNSVLTTLLNIFLLRAF